jgi:hypothetical protein
MFAGLTSEIWGQVSEGLRSGVWDEGQRLRVQARRVGPMPAQGNALGFGHKNHEAPKGL